MSRKALRMIIPLVSGLGLCILIVQSLNLSRAVSALSAGNSIILRPDQLQMTGDVATTANTAGYCTAPRLANMPPGSIIVGVNPISCTTTTWRGGAATAQLFLPAIYSPTVYTLKLSWLDRDGKGLHSPLRNKMAVMTLDGQTLWSKRTTQQSTFGDYYAAEHEPILTTIVVTQSVTHTLAISVPTQTAWDLSRIELSAYPYPARIKGIGYSPYRDCQSPSGTALPTAQDINDDVFRLAHTSNAIRTYAATGVNRQIPGLAKAAGLMAFAGAWLDHNTQDDDEIDSLINLANTTDLDGVIVGNEYYLRHRTQDDVNYLRQRISQVRSGVSNPHLPIMTAEIDNVMFDWQDDSSAVMIGIKPVYRPVLSGTDYVLVHIYPFWSGLPIEGAAAFVVQRYNAIKATIDKEYPGQHKRVIIGETGWPSGGQINKLAVPSLENQERYMREFLILADQVGVEYMYFDAFDELWKITAEGKVGQTWGYSFADRSAKYSFYGVLLPWETFFPLQIYLPTVLKQSGASISRASAVDAEVIQHMGSDRTQSVGIRSSNKIVASGAFSLPVYTEWLEGPGYFAPSVVGSVNDLTYYACDRTNPHGGDVSIRTSFSPTLANNWGGINWLYPPGNTGVMSSGLDLSAANKLTFWARGATGGEQVQFAVGGIGTAVDPYPESLRPEASTGFVRLNDTWKQYTIDLRGKNLTHMIRGFGWSTNQCANSGGTTLYLDDIRFEYDPNMPPPPPRGSTFPVYTDAGAPGNHYVPSGWMGDGAVPGRVSLTECWTNNPYSGTTSIRVSYPQVVTGWAGMYWVNPAENWGDRPGGYDLTGAKRVTFWARSAVPGQPVTFLVGGVGYNNGCSSPPSPYLYPDSICPTIRYTTTLSAAWTQYSIDFLTQNLPRDLGRVVGGFGWVSDHPITFYLDEIVYQFQ